MASKARVENRILRLALVPLLAPALVIAFVFLLFYGAYRLILRITVEIVWGLRGRRVLLVYSRSPLWQEYIEKNWLPKLGNHGIVLNWSDRAAWRRGQRLAVAVFRHWAPEKNFNPMAILFPPFGKTRRIGFFQAFRDQKHGKTLRLKEGEARLFSFLNTLRRGHT